jgi:GntR family transcriptional regulator
MVKSSAPGENQDHGDSPLSETRYAQVARKLAEGITSGRFPLGSLLPTELELCEHFSASRHTVRAALRELQGLGLVSRRKRVGTRVEATRVSGGYNESLASLEDLVQLAATHVRAVRKIDEVVADRPLARELGCRPGTRWLRISSLRQDEQDPARPIGWTDVYVDGAYAGLRNVVRKSPGVLISSMIETRYGRRIAEVRQTIEAASVPVEIAEALRAEPGSPALKIVRHYLDQAGKAFEISISIHPIGRFRFAMRLKRDRGTAPSAITRG